MRLAPKDAIRDTRKTLLRALAVAVLVAQTACLQSTQGTSTGNPMTSTGLVVTSSSQQAQVARNWIERIIDAALPSALALPTPSLSDSGGQAITLSKAWLSIADVEFRTTEADANSGSGLGRKESAPAFALSSGIAFSGPFFIDLLDAHPQPIGTAIIEQQPYRRIRLKLNDQGTIPNDAPTGLSGASAYFEGTVAGVAFSVTFDESTTFEVKGPRGVSPDSGHALALVFRMADLFKQIDLSAITGPTSISGSNKVTAPHACPVIDASANDLYTCFRKGLELRAKLGKDLNGDNDLGGEDESVDD